MRVKKGKDGKPLKDRNGNDITQVVRDKNGDVEGCIFNRVNGNNLQYKT
jgi:hypothetical protein